MITIDSHIKPPRQKKPKRLRTPDAVRSAYGAYSNAYFKVYAVHCTGFTYDPSTKFIYIGNSAGVTLKRLKEMVSMLQRRIG